MRGMGVTQISRAMGDRNSRLGMAESLVASSSSSQGMVEEFLESNSSMEVGSRGGLEQDNRVFSSPDLRPP